MWNCNLCHVLPQVPKYIGLVNVPKKEIAYILPLLFLQFLHCQAFQTQSILTVRP